MDFLSEGKVYVYLKILLLDQIVLLEIYLKTIFSIFLRIISAAPKFWTFFLTNLRIWEIASYQLKNYLFPVDSDGFRPLKKSRSAVINQPVNWLGLIVLNCRTPRHENSYVQD